MQNEFLNLENFDIFKEFSTFFYIFVKNVLKSQDLLKITQSRYEIVSEDVWRRKVKLCIYEKHFNNIYIVTYFHSNYKKIKFKVEVICNTLNKHKIKRYHFRERKSRWHWDSACAKVSLITRVSEFFQSPFKLVTPLNDDGLFRDVQLISMRFIRVHSKNQVWPIWERGKRRKMITWES